MQVTGLPEQMHVVGECAADMLGLLLDERGVYVKCWDTINEHIEPKFNVVTLPRPVPYLCEFPAVDGDFQVLACEADGFRKEFYVVLI